MKKLLFVCLMAILSVGAGAVERKDSKKKITKMTFVSDIHCQSCANKIMSNVAVLGRGIKDVVVDVPTKDIVVVFDESKNSLGNIVNGFAELKVKVTPKAMKLQSACAIKSPACKEASKCEQKVDGKCCTSKCGQKCDSKCVEKCEHKEEGKCCGAKSEKKCATKCDEKHNSKCGSKCDTKCKSK